MLSPTVPPARGGGPDLRWPFHDDEASALQDNHDLAERLAGTLVRAFPCRSL